ncbi:hypothetical protein [Bifidobacterium callitrichos]|uniref:Transposase DNA-binding domain protein n=1 Tax=Bifidobacterium callitrichos DSM 23973 TaxID=1437609 RepID=A0A086ZWA7_9BIFI|nr:hypothetical protein [Bifidobacterium callitrichos]KFI50807.1 transposase DNA-binding domain protein [Bifidobacterium callitrichos DSM 23973]
MSGRGEIACGAPGLEPVLVRDSGTGVELDPEEYEALFWSHLDHARRCQNMMIRMNDDITTR